jgi:hypothetical protein
MEDGWIRGRDGKMGFWAIRKSCKILPKFPL